MTSDTEAALLKAIAGNGGDDLPRLVYADWLDENGNAARADFTRLQVETFRMAVDDPERASLKKRELRLRKAHRREWEEPFRATGFHPSKFERGLVAVTTEAWDEPLDSIRWTEPSFPIHEFAGVRRLVLRQSRADAEFSQFIASPYLAGVRQLYLPSIPDAAIPSLLATPHLANLELLYFDPRTQSDETWELIARSTAHARLRELMIGGGGERGREAAERFVGFLREARADARHPTRPPPLPLLTRVNHRQLPHDLLPFSERVCQRSSGYSGRT